ncbi:hypothetical protein V6N13_040433 [Hibiscus sabdariffa]
MSTGSIFPSKKNNVYWEQGAREQSKNSCEIFSPVSLSWAILQTASLVAFMASTTDQAPDGVRVPVCCFTSVDWYGVWGRLDRGLSDGFTLFSVWLVEESSDDGLLVFNVDGAQDLVLGGSRLRSGSVEVGRSAVIWWKLYKDDGSSDGFAFGRYVREMEMMVLTFITGLRCRIRIEVSQRFSELKEEGDLADGWYVVFNVEVTWAWSWWRYRKKRTFCSVWVFRWLRRKIVWISVEAMGDSQEGFIDELVGAGSSLFRFPGMSWSKNVSRRMELGWEEGWCVTVLGKKVLKGTSEAANYPSECRRWICVWYVAGFENRVEGSLVSGFGQKTSVEGGVSFVLNSDGGRKLDGIVGWPESVFSNSGEGEVWLWWVNHNGLEEIKVCLRWSECLRLGRGWTCLHGLRGSSFWVLREVWMSSWWCLWKVKGEILRGKACGRWLWGSSRRSTAESKGRGKVTGDLLGYVISGCMACRRKGCTWLFSCGNLGPTGWLFSGQVVQWGTFPWRCGEAGLAGGPRLTCGAQGVLSSAYLWSDRCAFSIRFLMKRCILKGVKRSVLWISLVVLERSVKRNVWKERWKKVMQVYYVNGYGVLVIRGWTYVWGVTGIGNRIEGSLISGFVSLTPKEGGLCYSVRFDGVQKFDVLGVVGWTVTGGSVSGVWFWWGGGGRCLRGLQWPHFLVLQGVWRCSWWRSWRRLRRSTVESKGRKKVTGGFVVCRCMPQRGSETGKLGLTRSFFSGYVVQWGTFPWLCGVAGVAGYLRLTCGDQRRLLSKEALMATWSVFDNRFGGLIRCVFVVCFNGLKRSVLFVRSGGVKWSVLWGGSEEMERCVLWTRWVGVKRCVLEEYPNEAKRGVLRTKSGIFGGGSSGTKRNVLTIIIIYVLRCLKTGFSRVQRSVLKIGFVEVKRCVSKYAVDNLKRCVLRSRLCCLKALVLNVVLIMERCVLGNETDLVLYLENVSTCRGFIGVLLGIILSDTERSFLWKEILEMADEVANLMNNLCFSEEELVEMESMETQCKEQQCDTEKWVVAKLFTMRKVDGSGEDRGQQVQHAQLRPRGPKRVLQGKYEVCTPVGSKKARSASSSQGAEVEGGLEVVSPLKTSIRVEAAMQPR